MNTPRPGTKNVPLTPVWGSGHIAGQGQHYFLPYTSNPVDALILAHAICDDRLTGKHAHSTGYVGAAWSNLQAMLRDYVDRSMVKMVIRVVDSGG